MPVTDEPTKDRELRPNWRKGRCSDAAAYLKRLDASTARADL
jgi:hypothetical protein